MVFVSGPVCPGVSVNVTGKIESFVTAILPPLPPLAVLTVTFAGYETEELVTDVAVMVAEPAALAVTRPLEDTVATLGLLLTQVTF